MVLIYYIRHAENLANLTKEFSYKKVDYSLTEKGKLQAQQTAEFMTTLLPKPIALYSSPLKRTIETATIIGNKLKLPVIIKEEFREINVGDLEGREVTPELWMEHNAIREEWMSGNHEIRFPGGENYKEHYNRAKQGILDVIQQDPVIIIGHGGMLSTILDEIAINYTRENQDIDVQNCSITQIEVLHTNPLQVKLLTPPDASHLSGIAAELEPGEMILD
ncbi:MAG: histidine phosphatase family protein [Candidatus Heimdallarchaeota archaeon]|nr:histidine phosphatase family protein [Candidatus Heimdallarchaeota archaeon]